MTQVSAQYAPKLHSGNRPGRLWSLFDMLTFHAARFVEAAQFMTATRGLLTDMENDQKDGQLTAIERKVSQLDTEMEGLRTACIPLGLTLTVKEISRLLSSRTVPWPYSMVRQQVVSIYDRFRDELEQQSVYALRPNVSDYYTQPRLGWESVTARFKCSFDVEEARKCIALERYTAAVFHFMRIVERAVLELQMFLEKKDDPKAHFGSVIGKLENLTQKTEYPHLPDHLKGHMPFLKDVLSQLHAVKDSWRDKVSHVTLIPTGPFTEEMAVGIHDATRLLMQKIVAGIPGPPEEPADPNWLPIPSGR